MLILCTIVFAIGKPSKKTK